MTETAPYRTKMIEVGLPLEAINAASAREKSIKHGHPSTLHLYWARRPLAACRAVLFSSLVDDPSADPAYKNKGEEAIQERRQELHDLLTGLVLWESTNDEQIINRARAEIASSLASFAAEKGEIDASDWPGVIERTAKPDLVNRYLDEVAPPVIDPFAGGGSIPLEAQRLGLRAYASDLNPVAVLINKALIEIPPKFANQPPVNPQAQEDNLGTMTWKGAQGLAEDVRYYGQWMRDEAEKRIGHLYPKVKITQEMAKDRPDLEKYQGQELTVMAWKWARTVKCPNPACSHRAPMTQSFWLSKKKGKTVYLEPILDATTGSIDFKVRCNGSPIEGTSNRNEARCLFCDQSWKKAELRRISTEDGLNAIPMAIVAEGERERVYIEATASKTIQVKRPDVPEIDVEITNDKRWFSPPLYGLPMFSDLFTNRQLTALCTLSDLVKDARSQLMSDAPNACEQYANAVAIYLAMTVNRQANRLSTLCFWDDTSGKIQQTFGRQALPMVWDFCEANPFSNSSGNWLGQLSWPIKVIERHQTSTYGLAFQADATQPTPHNTPFIYSTDPPYYDNIGYADLSDFFYVWLRRSLADRAPDSFGTLLTPKTQELIASPYRHDGDKAAAEEFFERGLGLSIKRMEEGTVPDIPITIFYAFKQTEDAEAGTISTGWATFLEGVMNAGLSVVATIPMRTELTGNLKKKVNALASSIVLACRPRAVDASITTRTDFVRELRVHLGKALADLQQSSIAPVDLQQAAIGPGMAVFSKYAKVLENDGSEMSVRAALGLINQALEEVLSEQEGEFDADTRFATIWFEQFRFDTGDYGTAETLAKAKAISVDGVVDSGILESTGGSVRLLKPEELDEDWTPEDDDRLTVWEVTHYLCRALETGGIDSAADLVRRVGGLSDSARDLAYRLFSICDKKKWATEAQPYNALVASWPDIQNAAAQQPAANTTDEQSGLFEG